MISLSSLGFDQTLAILYERWREKWEIFSPCVTVINKCCRETVEITMKNRSKDENKQTFIEKLKTFTVFLFIFSNPIRSDYRWVLRMAVVGSLAGLDAAILREIAAALNPSRQQSQGEQQTESPQLPAASSWAQSSNKVSRRFFRRLTVLHGKGRLFSRLLPKSAAFTTAAVQRSNGAFWVSHELCVFGAIKTLRSAGTGRLHRQGLREFATAERSRHSSRARQWPATANAAGNHGWR